MMLRNKGTQDRWKSCQFRGLGISTELMSVTATAFGKTCCRERSKATRFVPSLAEMFAVNPGLFCERVGRLLARPIRVCFPLQTVFQTGANAPTRRTSEPSGCIDRKWRHAPCRRCRASAAHACLWPATSGSECKVQSRVGMLSSRCGGLLTEEDRGLGESRRRTVAARLLGACPWRVAPSCELCGGVGAAIRGNFASRPYHPEECKYFNWLRADGCASGSPPRRSLAACSPAPIPLPSRSD